MSDFRMAFLNKQLLSRINAKLKAAGFGEYAGDDAGKHGRSGYATNLIDHISGQDIDARKRVSEIVEREFNAQTVGLRYPIAIETSGRGSDAQYVAILRDEFGRELYRSEPQPEKGYAYGDAQSVRDDLASRDET